MRPGWLWITLLLLMTGAPLRASDETMTPVDSLRARMLEAFEAIPDYRVEMNVDIDMPGMKVSDKAIRLDFQQPDSFRYKARGFALLPRRSVSMSPRSLFEGLANARLLAPLDSLPSVLRLSGEYREGGEIAEVEFWIDEAHLVPVHFRISLRGKTVMQMDTEYRQLPQGSWLPAESRLKMLLDADLQDFYEKLKMPMRRRKNLQNELGQIEIRYGDYELSP